MSENQISYQIIGAAIELHKTLGPGLLESAYENSLAYELVQRGLSVETQIAMPLIYKEVKQDVAYRIDLLVNKKVIIELKSVEKLAPVHYSQTITYLRLSPCKLALLINFNVKVLKDGIHRFVDNL